MRNYWIALIALLALAAGYAVFPRMWSGSYTPDIHITGTVVDPNGCAVTGARVFLSQDSGSTLCADPVWTEESGAFVLHVSGRGFDRLVAEKEGFAPNWAYEMALTSRGEYSGIVLTLQSGGRIVGQLLDEGGRPEPNRLIEVASSAGTGRQSVTDLSGFFRFVDLPPGETSVWVWPTEDERHKLASNLSECLVRSAQVTVYANQTTYVCLDSVRR